MHQEKVSGFEDPNVLVTAEFIQLHNDLLDILNSRSLSAPGFKKAITYDNFTERYKIFQQIREMYDVIYINEKITDRKTNLVHYENKKLIHSNRRTAFLGLLTCMESIEMLVTYMFLNILPLKFLCTYKLCQDFLEIFFNKIRSSNGWSFNPTCSQFRYAYRKMVVHVGKSILASAMANCKAQDETSVLMIATSNNFCGYEKHIVPDDPEAIENIISANFANEQDERTFNSVMREHECRVTNCVFCQGALAYIAGYLPFSILKSIKCNECVSALRDSPEDPCPKKSLILLKNYVPIEDIVAGIDNCPKGLFVPSGSLCDLIFLAEKIFRAAIQVTHDPENPQFSVVSATSSTGVVNIINGDKPLDHLTYITLYEAPKDLFLGLQESGHCDATFYGLDNHMVLLIQVILKKFFALRIKKFKKDQLLSGNHILRNRVFAAL